MYDIVHVMKGRHEAVVRGNRPKLDDLLISENRGTLKEYFNSEK